MTADELEAVLHRLCAREDGDLRPDLVDALARTEIESEPVLVKRRGLAGMTQELGDQRSLVGPQLFGRQPFGHRQPLAEGANLGPRIPGRRLPLERDFPVKHGHCQFDHTRLTVELTTSRAPPDVTMPLLLEGMNSRVNEIVDHIAPRA